MKKIEMPRKKEIPQEGLSAERHIRERNIGFNLCHDEFTAWLAGIDVEKRLWEALPDIHQEVTDYELRADEGDYCPTTHESMLIEDFMHGFLDEFISRLATAIKTMMREQ